MRTMLEYDLEESVGYWVIPTARALVRALNEELAGFGLTHRQWQVLVWISQDASICQAELARRLCIEAPTLVGVLDRMERDGWLAREEDAEDRRKRRLRLLPTVRPVWNRMVECARRVRERATAGLDEPEVRQLRAMLERVRRNLEESPENP